MSVKYWLCKYGLGTKRVHKCACGETNEDKFTLGRFSQCKKCRSKLQGGMYKKYKLQSIEYKGGKCSKCGYDKCTAALDFHHLDPKEKDPDWKKMRHWRFGRVKKELDKCVLVCRNCHAEIHYPDCCNHSQGLAPIVDSVPKKKKIRTSDIDPDWRRRPVSTPGRWRDHPKMNFRSYYGRCQQL